MSSGNNIGITDIDGIEVCEGDIVRIRGWAEYQGMRELDKVGVITYSSASFDVVTKDDVHYGFNYLDIDSIDILGNIYETLSYGKNFENLKALGGLLKPTIIQMNSTKKPSLGEQRVRTTFNPSNASIVDEIKQKSAELINLMEALMNDEVSKTYEQSPEAKQLVSGETLRLISLAQTTYEEAAMWAVKAATA